MKSANHYKGNKTPYEAFHKNKDGFNYDEILERAQVFNKSKFDRFTKDAMNIYNKDGKDFITRQLSDTQYISRISLKYLKSLYPKEKHSSIWTIPGQLTAMIRGRLGLNDILSDNNEKNRNDHRHHAVDAFVVAITTRSFLQKISSAANDMEELYNMNKYANRKRILDKMPEPFTNYRKSLEVAVNNIKTSHKADRSISGCLHKDTAYGLVRDNNDYNLVRRQGITESINFDLVRDKELRELLNNEKTRNEIIEKRNIRHIRTLKKYNPIISIKDRNNKIYKVFEGGNNICAEIFEVPNDKKYVEVITLFDASQKNFTPEWINKYPNAKLVMRLFKGDVVGYIDNRKYKYALITQITNDRFVMEEINYHSKSDEYIIRKSHNQFANILNVKQFNISVSGVITKKKTADINFWNNRK